VIHKPAWNAGLLRRLLPSYLLAAATGVMMLAGFFAVIEMIYHYEAKESATKAFSYFGITLDPAQAGPWVGTLLVFAVGTAVFHAATRVVRRAWDALTPELQAKGAV
jgi:branched-chain amino acid transport system permease protein